MSALDARPFAREWVPWAALVGVAWLAAAGCFSPRQPACAFTCLVAPNRCPENYACGEDGLCHRADADAACTLAPPAGGGADAGAAADAAAGASN